MTKLWCIAMQFGDTKTGSLGLAHSLSPTVELAAAQAVSQFYATNPGVRLPLAGIAVLELPRERLEEALRAMDEEEQKPPSVVQLVAPKSTGEFAQWTDEMIANHFGQSKTKAEIDRLAGRKLNWDTIEEATRQSWRDEPA